MVVDDIVSYSEPQCSAASRSLASELRSYAEQVVYLACSSQRHALVYTQPFVYIVQRNLQEELRKVLRETVASLNPTMLFFMVVVLGLSFLVAGEYLAKIFNPH